MTPLQKYYELLDEAHGASEESDAFDVDSANIASSASYNERLWREFTAHKALAEHLRNNPDLFAGDWEGIMR